MANKKKSPQQDKQQEDKGSPMKDYARYSNLAFRWIAIILVCFFGGQKLDELLKLNFPVFTLVLAVSGLFLSMYLLIKELNK